MDKTWTLTIFILCPTSIQLTTQKTSGFFFCMEHWFKIGVGWGGGTSWDNLRPKIQTLVAHILLLIIDVMLCKCKITITSVGKLLAVITVKYI